MEQTGGFVGRLTRQGGWVRQGDGSEVPMPPATVQFVHGHELHALVLEPLARLRTPVLRDTTLWGTEPALVIELRDTLNAPVYILYSAQDTLPMGMRFTSQDPDVDVRFGQFEAAGPFYLFRSATFQQADEVFRYTYVSIRPGPIPDSIFTTP